MQGQTICVLAKKQLMKAENVNSWLPNMDLNRQLVIQLIF